MKVIVTDASGFPGQYLLNALIKMATTVSNDKIEIYATYGSMEGFKDTMLSSIEDKDSISINVDKMDLQSEEMIQSYVKSNGPFDICYHVTAM